MVAGREGACFPGYTPAVEIQIEIGSAWRNIISGRRIRVTKVENGMVYFEATNGDQLSDARVAVNAFFLNYEEPR